jgi:2',3'-cyclic-nucleotide 2'-phosphodiesterase (5'-nucleotidase family)
MRFWLVMAVLLLWVDQTPAREVRLSILHTANLDGHILPVRNESDGESGGLLRCASVMRQIRHHEPHVLYIDTGNTLAGSIESDMSGGSLVLSALAELECDAWVPGIHDWGWGLKRLQRLSRESRVPMVAANVGTRVGRPDALPSAKPYSIKDIDGVKVAIVGLTSPGVPLWHPAEVLGDALFVDSLESLRAVMPDVRQESPDVWILAVHQALLVFDDAANQVHAIARAFPEFDVIIGGQRGEAVADRRIGECLYTEAGSRGRTLGRVNLVYDTVEGRVTSKSGHLQDLSGIQQGDDRLKRILGRDLVRAEGYGRQRLGETVVALPAVPQKGSPTSVQGLICKAVRSKTKADVVLHAMGHETGLEAGEIQMRDVWDMIPVDSEIALLELTPSEVKQVLEENTRYVGTPHFAGILGMRYDLRARAPLNERVKDVRMIDNSRPHPRRKLRVALSSSLASSNGGRLQTLRQLAEESHTNLRLTGVDMREAVIEYIRAASPFGATE